MTLIIARHASHPISETDFENPIWQQCQDVTINHYWSGESAIPDRHAEAKICWSDEALHVRFVGVQREPLVVSDNPQTEKKTLGLWDRDVCEIFIAPDPTSPSHYFEFEAAPTGEWIDLGIIVKPEGRETDWDFVSRFKTAARLEHEQLLVGMKIPWSDAIPKPSSGDSWRVNLFRCVGPEAPERYLAWQPTRTPEPNFHVPEVFGILQFEL
ncbi:MAG TPA: carbohydrate-binding family 9-like protein [Pyrinomonadaceae bacterium]|nr:carbohydrate-binding family 9-like protein [Pyrinomonadaceae bacterium]